MKLKKGDKVVVISGKDKGKEGDVSEVLPRKNKVMIAGVNISKRHLAARGNANTGGIIDKDMPFDASNVMFVHKGKPTRLGYLVKEDGTKVRVAKSTGEEV
ncbi:MAG: 50S ribosomal protein L24 [Ilumatobacteraceae bacterium]